MHSKTAEMIIFAYLLSAFCIPSSLGLFKRIANTSNSVGAATWSVSLNQTGVNNHVEVIPSGNNGSYTLNVQSNSEVDVVYEIKVSGIPSGVEVKLDSGSFQTPTSGVVTFTNAGTILYSDVVKQKTHTLTFKANSGAATVNNQTVTIDVNFKQDY